MRIFLISALFAALSAGPVLAHEHHSFAASMPTSGAEPTHAECHNMMAGKSEPHAGHQHMAMTEAEKARMAEVHKACAVMMADHVDDADDMVTAPTPPAQPVAPPQPEHQH